MRAPGLNEIELGLINADYQTGPLDPDVMHAVIAEPAYWAFCWGSGLASARWILDHPEQVAGKRVADFGSGSGVVAIALAMAGAAEVWACDNDPLALAASAGNAALNHQNVRCIEDLAQLPHDLDTLYMADVLYDRANFALIDEVRARAKRMIIADSRVQDVEHDAFLLTHQMQALTFPNLGEFEEFRTVRFFVSD